MKSIFGSIVIDSSGMYRLEIRRKEMNFVKRFYTEDAARLEGVLKYIEYLGAQASEAKRLLGSFDFQKIMERESAMEAKALKDKPHNKMLKKRIENKAGTWVHDPERPKENLPIGGNHNGKKGNAEEKV